VHACTALTALFPQYSLLVLPGTVEESCCAYEALDSTRRRSDAFGECRSCIAGVCKAIDPPRFYADYFGLVAGEIRMMGEIYANGPIICRLRATTQLLGYTGGILCPNDADEFIDRNHAVAIVGWGVETTHDRPWVHYGRGSARKIPYWLVRNTWGRHWVSSAIRTELEPCSLLCSVFVYDSPHSSPCAKGRRWMAAHTEGRKLHGRRG
jgi:hypothetical protein